MLAIQNNIKSMRILASLLVLFSFSSCEDILDTETYSAISDSDFWQTNKDAELGVAAIYDAMQATYRLNHFLWGEFRADNYVVSDQAEAAVESLITNNLTPDYEMYGRWNAFYSMILRANTAIEKIPNIAAYDKNLLGEAYALRAYAYFDAYRVWGGVPLFTEASLVLNSDSYKEKASPQEVLDLVLSDLAQAEALITNVTSNYRFSVASILAFKAKVHMYFQEYAEANTALQALIDLNMYSLTDTRESWRDLFMNDQANFPGIGQEGPELILSLNFNLEEDGNRASGVYTLFYQGIPTYWVSQDIREKWLQAFPTDQAEWEAKYPGIPPHSWTNPTTGLTEDYYGDWRYHETIEEASLPEDIRVKKYSKTNYSPFIDDTNIVLFRYADMLLLKAEAENKLGNDQAAIDLVNEIRNARKLPTLVLTDYTTVEDRENLILDERQFELFAEGTRWWDLVRTDKAVEVLGPINGMTEEKIIWPIYFRHLIDNHKLEQNEAYK